MTLALSYRAIEPMWKGARRLGVLTQLYRERVDDWRLLKCAHAHAKYVGEIRNAKLVRLIGEVLAWVRVRMSEVYRRAPLRLGELSRVGKLRFGVWGSAGLRGGLLSFYLSLKNASAPRELLSTCTVDVHPETRPSPWRSRPLLLPMISVIVPFKTFDRYVMECLHNCLRLDYPSFEVLLLPDFDTSTEEAVVRSDKVRVIATGTVIPPVKRNAAAEKALGEILAFIDSDAYPRSDWLRNAVRYFEDEAVVAVGGPGLTPESDSLAQKASGEILASMAGSWTFRFRHQATTVRECDDLPTANLLVRRSAFLQVKGFDPSYWTGEDTEFCLRILQLKKKMLYAPDAVVYHHRRPVFRDHLKQISRYGLHRGYFARKFPETSRRPIYFAPSGFVLFLLAGLPVAILYWHAAFLYATGVAVYLSVCIVAAAKSAAKAHSLKMLGMVASGIILTHVFYGLSFLKGLLSSRLLDQRNQHAVSYEFQQRPTTRAGRMRDS